jgi:hypothetical protein
MQIGVRKLGHWHFLTIIDFPKTFSVHIVEEMVSHSVANLGKILSYGKIFDLKITHLKEFFD